LDAGNERESGKAKARSDSFACPIARELGASPAFVWLRIVADSRALIRRSVKTQNRRKSGKRSIESAQSKALNLI
jgi:hypothetical protein